MSTFTEPWDYEKVSGWEEVDGEDLDSFFRGLLILAAEPIDYPNTDGIVFYLTRPGTGERITVTVNAIHPEDMGEECVTPLCICKGVPEEDET